MNHKVSKEESMNTVLLQEVTRYNNLLKRIKSSLIELGKAIEGETVMNLKLEAMGDAILNGAVPSLWKEVSYPSIKPLGGYFEDLEKRIEFLQEWDEFD